MRIALFSDTYPPEINGVSTSVHTLANVLIKNGHQVLVVTTNPFSDEVTYSDGLLRIPGAELKKIYGYRITGIYNKIAMRYIRKFNPEILHNQTDFGIGLFARVTARLLDIPLVYTYHTMYEEYTYYVTKGHFDRVARATMRTYSKNMITHSTSFITPSSKTKDYMRRIGIDKYANIIPTGIDFEKFYPDNIDQSKVEEIRKKHNIKPNVFTLLSLGRIAKEKSIDVSIDGYNAFVKKYPDIESQMVIVGGGPALEELKQQAKKLGIENNVIFTGPCNPSEVQFYYALGSAFISASLTETQGLTYMEAMAAHLFVLGRFDHNLLDVISEGKTGYFFEDSDECANKLYEAYKQYIAKDETMLLEAIKSIDNYSLPTFYDRVIEVYKRALKQYW